ncbi:MAG TPA: hypothetical protein VL485_25995 [Ktedonobacteraceae bacterium]|jgi:hypothetical protein|nr:hypothetical protein [Ktedonobacteraceae bacterium]
MKLTRILLIGIAALILLLMGALLSLLFVDQQQSFSSSPTDNNAKQPNVKLSPTKAASPTSSATQNATSSAPVFVPTTPTAGAHVIQLAISQDTLTSLLLSQLGTQQNTLTNLQIIPMPNDEIILQANLQIATSGLHRMMPIELDCTIGLNAQQEIQLSVLHVKRDGVDIGHTAASNIQTAMNLLLVRLLMPSIHSQLKGMKLISVHTSAALCCGVNSEMLVLLLQLS